MLLPKKIVGIGNHGGYSPGLTTRCYSSLGQDMGTATMKGVEPTIRSNLK